MLIITVLVTLALASYVQATGFALPNGDFINCNGPNTTDGSNVGLLYSNCFGEINEDDVINCHVTISPCTIDGSIGNSNLGRLDQCFVNAENFAGSGPDSTFSQCDLECSGGAVAHYVCST